MVKTSLFSTLFVCFFNCVFEVKTANAVVDPTDFVSNIFDNTINVKTEKIQPDIKPTNLLKVKTEKIQPDIPKFPTKKTERLLPNMDFVDDVKDVLLLNPKKYADEFSNPDNIKKSFMYMVGADIIEEELKKKSKKQNQETNGEVQKSSSSSKSAISVDIISLGEASRKTDIFGKPPSAVPLYGKTPVIKHPIDDLGNITAKHLDDVAPIHKVLPSISQSGGEIMDDVNGYLDDTIDLFEGDSKPAPEKVLDSKIMIFD